MTNQALVVLAAVTAMGGCMVGGDEPNLATSLRALSSSKWMSCWVRPGSAADPEEQPDALICNVAVRDGVVAIQRVSGTAIWKLGTDQRSTDVHITRAEDSVVARVPRNQYPIRFYGTIALSPTEEMLRRMLGSGRGLNIGFELMIDRFDRFTPEQPLVIEQPFDLWPIEVEIETPTMALTLEPYAIPLPMGLTTKEGAKVPAIEFPGFHAPVVSSAKTVLFHVPVAPGERTKLVGQIVFDRGINNPPKARLELDGPGAYTLTEEGLKRREPSSETGTGTSTHQLESCPPKWSGDGVCDRCLSEDPDCAANGEAGCEAQWRGDSVCDECLGDDPDCATAAACPSTWRGDGICDECLGDDPDCAETDCPGYYRDDGVCDPCLGNDPDCGAGTLCPSAWRNDGLCDACLGDDPDCEDASCPADWRDDGTCDECLGDDPDCDQPGCPIEWSGDGTCDTCLGDDPDCAPLCPMEWYGDGVCDECLTNDPDCEDESCPWSWYDDGICDDCLGDDPDC